MSSDSHSPQPSRAVLKHVVMTSEQRQIGGRSSLTDATGPASPSVEPPAFDALKEEVLQQAHQEAESILARARQQASQMLAEAETRVQALEKEARQRGLAQGESAARAELSQALDQLQTVFESSQQERKAILLKAEQEVVHLVLEITRRLLKIEPLINEQALIRVTRHALEHLGQKLEVIIEVHPEDVELLHFSLSQLEDLALDIVIEPKEDIHIGSCRVRSKAGRIDANLNTQFDTIAQSFLAMAEGDKHD